MSEYASPYKSAGLNARARSRNPRRAEAAKRNKATGFRRGYHRHKWQTTELYFDARKGKTIHNRVCTTCGAIR